MKSLLQATIIITLKQSIHWLQQRCVYGAAWFVLTDTGWHVEPTLVCFHLRAVCLTDNPAVLAG